MEKKYSVISVVAGIVGLIGFFLGIFFSLPGILLGIIGLVHISSNKEKYKGIGLCWFAIVIGLINTAVFFM